MCEKVGKLQQYLSGEENLAGSGRLHRGADI